MQQQERHRCLSRIGSEHSCSHFEHRVARVAREIGPIEARACMGTAENGHTHVLGPSRGRLAASRSGWGGAAGGAGRAGRSERASGRAATALIGVTATPLASLRDGQLEPLGAQLSSRIGRVCRPVDAPLLRAHEGREAVAVRRAGLGGVACPAADVTAPFPRSAERNASQPQLDIRSGATSHGWCGAARRGGSSGDGGMESIVAVARAIQAPKDVAGLPGRC